MACNPRLHRLGSPLARAFCPGVSGPLSSGTWRPLSHPSQPALADPLTSFPPRAAPCSILCPPCSYRRRRPTARDPAPPRPARPAAGRYHRLCRRRNRRQSEHRSHRRGRSGISLVVHCHAVGRGRAGRGSMRPCLPQQVHEQGQLGSWSGAGGGRRERAVPGPSGPFMCALSCVRLLTPSSSPVPLVATLLGLLPA